MQLYLCVCAPQYSIALPNPYNFVFDLHTVIITVLVAAYGLGAPFLYFHMLAQRKRKLAPTNT